MRKITFSLLPFGLLATLLLSQCGTAKPRIAVGGISHETNSFNPTRATLENFQERRTPWKTREEWLEMESRSNSGTTGMIEAAQAHGLDLYPVYRAGAGSMGPVDDAAFDTMTEQLIQSLKQSPGYDGVILTLHGAMVVEGHPSGDAEIVRRVRQAMGPDFPIVVTHDFHANVDTVLIENANAVVTGKECPHLDTKNRGYQATEILAGMLKSGVRPVQALVKPPMLLNLIHHDTYKNPLKPIVDASKEAEKIPGILAVSIPGGYQWSDVPNMGPSVIVITDNDPELAKKEAERLGEMLYRLREQLTFDLPDPATAVKLAMESNAFPVALIDTGDNIGGGGAGDSTFVLQELLRQKAQGWVVTIADPEATKKAFAAGVGQSFDEAVGGKTDNMHGEPVRVRGHIKSLHDGRYIEPEVRHGGGRYRDMGLTAVIEVEGSTRDLQSLLLLTVQRTSPNSIHQIVSNGVYPERQKILVVKGCIAPRAAYEPIAARLIEVDSPGASAVNPARFTYSHVRRPLFGLEQ